MSTLIDTLLREWAEDTAADPVVPAQRAVAVVVAHTSTGPARRRLPVAAAARALQSARGEHEVIDLDARRTWAEAAHAVPVTIASVLTGHRA